MHGTIQRLRADRGFGFLRAEGETRDRFFHFTALSGGLMLEHLVPGTRVAFDHQDGEKGPRATNITLAD
jgi:CspA family cold shock protein